MKIQTENVIRRRLKPDRVIAVIEEAFRDRYLGAEMPVRTHLDLAGGAFLIMSCYDRSRNALGIKLVVVQHKPGQSDNRVRALYMLLDTASVFPKAIMSADYMTDLRTAGVSAVATKFLARADARTLGIFGTGRQAEAHATVLPYVRKFSRVFVCGSNISRSLEFAKRMSAQLGMPFESVDARTCVTESDVLCTCTTATEPLFDGNLIRPGTHLNLVGAFQPSAREVDDVTIAHAKVVVDTYDGTLKEAGDLLIPMEKGLISKEHVLADLHELVSGKKPVRTGTADITVFKSVGCCFEDLVTAELVENTPA